MKFNILVLSIIKYSIVIAITILLTAQYCWHQAKPLDEPSPATRRQPTHNCTKSAQEATFALFLLVSHKHMHYEHLIESLVRSDLPRSTSIFISHDANNDVMLALSDRLRQTFTRTSIVLHPFSCNATDDTMKQQHEGFPRFDPSGKELNYWQWSCAKNHWVWAMNRVWNYYPRLQWLLYLEEDFVVAKHFFRLQRALSQRAASAGYFGTMLQCRDNLWTVSGCLKRATWLAIKDHSKFYCALPEYNWDLTLKQTMLHYSHTQNLQYVCPKVKLAEHLGVFGKGLTHGTAMPEDELRTKMQQARDTFYRATDDVVGLSSEQIERQHFHTVHGGLGGYDKAFQKHCLEVMSYFETHAKTTFQFD